MIRRLESFLGGLPQFYVLLLGLALTAAIRGLAQFFGADLAISFLYILPICLVAWYVGGAWAVIMPVLATVAALQADISSRDVFRHPHTPYWNAVAQFVCFMVISRLLVLRRIRASAIVDKKDS